MTADRPRVRHPRAVPQPPARIDVTQALAALTGCIHSRARQRSFDGRDDDRCSLVHAALAQLGLQSEDLAIMPIVSEHATDRTPTAALTIGAVVALRAADRAERRGSTWTQALSAARRDVVRLLSIVPRSVMEQALDSRDHYEWQHS